MARPVYLQQRTYLVTAGMAVECHLRTHAPQQTRSIKLNALFDTFVTFVRERPDALFISISCQTCDGPFRVLAKV